MFDEQANQLLYLSIAIDWISALLLPLLNSNIFLLLTKLNTLIKVPFSDAVANNVPSVFNVKA